MSYFTKRQA